MGAGCEATIKSNVEQTPKYRISKIFLLPKTIGYSNFCWSGSQAQSLLYEVPSIFTRITKRRNLRLNARLVFFFSDLEIHFSIIACIDRSKNIFFIKVHKVLSEKDFCRIASCGGRRF